MYYYKEDIIKIFLVISQMLQSFKEMNFSPLFYKFWF